MEYIIFYVKIKIICHLFLLTILGGIVLTERNPESPPAPPSVRRERTERLC